MPQISFSNPFEGQPTQALDPLSVLSFIQQMKKQQELKTREESLNAYSSQIGGSLIQQHGLNLPPPADEDQFRILAAALPAMVEESKRPEIEGILGQTIESFDAARDKLAFDRASADLEALRQSMNPQTQFRGLTGARTNIESVLANFTQTPEDEPEERYLRDALMSAVDLTPESGAGELEAGTKYLSGTLDDMTRLFPADKQGGGVLTPAQRVDALLAPVTTKLKMAQDQYDAAQDSVVGLEGAGLIPDREESLAKARRDLGMANARLANLYTLQSEAQRALLEGDFDKFNTIMTKANEIKLPEVSLEDNIMRGSNPIRGTGAEVDQLGVKIKTDASFVEKVLKKATGKQVQAAKALIDSQDLGLEGEELMQAVVKLLVERGIVDVPIN